MRADWTLMRPIFSIVRRSLSFCPDIDAISAIAIPALFVLMPVERRVVGAARELLPADRTPKDIFRPRAC